MGLPAERGFLFNTTATKDQLRIRNEESGIKGENTRRGRFSILPFIPDSSFLIELESE
jgi:hypothetical protein